MQLRTGTLALLALATLALIHGPSPAAAVADDTVTLVVVADEKLLGDHTAFTWDLTVALSAISTDAGGPANALDLLAHVVAEQDSTYTLSYFDTDGDGDADEAFVDEINGVASEFTLGLVGYFWALYENDVSSADAINDVVLEANDVIKLEYTGWPVDA